MPAMSNMPEASETPSTYQGMTLPPRKYDWMSREARFDTQ